MQHHTKSWQVTIDLDEITADMLRKDLDTLPKFSATRALVSELLETIPGDVKP